MEQNKHIQEGYQISVKVSVVVATYKQPQVLPLALASLLDQTLSDIEIIVVPYAEDEETMALLKNYPVETVVSKEKNYIHQRNLGIEKAKGEYVTFFDSDDFALPYKLEQEYALAKLKDAALVYSTYIRADGTLTPLVLGNVASNFLFDVPIMPPPSYQALLQSCYIYDFSLVAAGMYTEFGPLDEKLKQAAMYDKWLHIMENYGHRIFFNPHPTFLYRTYPEQMHLTEQQRPEHNELMNQVRMASLERYQKRQRQWQKM